jgi:hypothetical protein
VVWHVVLLKPRPGLSRAGRDALVSAFRRAVDEIPTVREVRVGRRVVHGAAYEATTADADYFVSIGFDDLAGLQIYLAHPAHRELGERFAQSVSAAQVYDFESGGVEGIAVEAG